jgi:hypothetical protein
MPVVVPNDINRRYVYFWKLKQGLKCSFRWTSLVKG